MPKQPDNLVLEMLGSIRAEQEKARSVIEALRGEANLKIGSLAESMVSMRKEVSALENAVQGMRTDMRMIAIAVDEHTHRLDKIEERLPPART